VRLHNERVNVTNRAVKVLYRQLCVGQSEVYMFVCEISINDQTATECKHNNDQTQQLITLHIFFGMGSCLMTCVQIIVTDCRAALGGQIQLVFVEFILLCNKILTTDIHTAGNRKELYLFGKHSYMFRYY
jgi:hypothetical protein